MKILELTFRVAACAMPALVPSLTLAQTCAAGVQASNPTSVYVIDSVNGTVTDSRTGLMWDRCRYGQSGAGCDTGGTLDYVWQAALGQAALLGTYKGFNDWRLPNIKELRSLVEECRFGPGINEFAFPNTSSSAFWSGSPSAGDTTLAWYVHFFGGQTTLGDRSDTFPIRLVRAGQ